MAGEGTARRRRRNRRERERVWMMQQASLFLFGRASFNFSARPSSVWSLALGQARRIRRRTARELQRYTVSFNLLQSYTTLERDLQYAPLAGKGMARIVRCSPTDKSLFTSVKGHEANTTDCAVYICRICDRHSSSDCSFLSEGGTRTLAGAYRRCSSRPVAFGY